MLLPQKDNMPSELAKELKEYVYDVVGFAMEVCKHLPCGLPEYVYQEVFAKVVRSHGIDPLKEFQYHPIFMGEPMEAYVKMDFMIERQRGNIIVEAKAIAKLTSHERQQHFGYMVATNFPIGILVNFATYPHPTIEKYYFDRKDMTLTAF